jgi:hypothetical protein
LSKCILCVLRVSVVIKAPKTISPRRHGEHRESGGT